MAEPPSAPPVPRLPRPPRSLSLGARLAVLFGGVLALVGSLVTGFSLVFFWVFFMRSELALDSPDDGRWQAVTARVILAKGTNASIDVHRYTIEYETAGGRTARFQTRTHRAALVEDEETEGLLYDPDRPDRGALLDTLPVVPLPGPDGVLRVTRSAALASLTAPVLCLLPHAAWAVWRYAL